jgi:hypothetical protein
MMEHCDDRQIVGFKKNVVIWLEPIIQSSNMKNLSSPDRKNFFNFVHSGTDSWYKS